MKEITLESERIFEGRVFKVKRDKVELDDGSTSSREVIIHNGGSSIVAVDNEDNIFLVRQFRYAMGKVIYEIPAGKLEEGEDPLECAKRELIEETGYRAGKIEHLIEEFATPGYDSEKINIYKATDLEFVGQHLDPGEFLEVVKVPLSKAVDMIFSGEIQDSKTAIGILMTARQLNI